MLKAGLRVGGVVQNRAQNRRLLESGLRKRLPRAGHRAEGPACWERSLACEAVSSPNSQLSGWWRKCNVHQVPGTQ